MVHVGQKTSEQRDVCQEPHILHALARRLEQLGIGSPTFLLMDDLLYVLSLSHPKKKL